MKRQQKLKTPQTYTKNSQGHKHMKHGKQIVKETHTTKNENLHVLILQTQTHQKKTLKIEDNFHRQKKTKN
jgi:hypothetical protein